MVKELDRDILRLVTREQGEELVLNKIDELVRETNRLEQILEFLSGVSTDNMGDPNDVQ